MKIVFWRGRGRGTGKNATVVEAILFVVRVCTITEW
jgi:hypothetical protein